LLPVNQNSGPSTVLAYMLQSIKHDQYKIKIKIKIKH